MDSSVPTPPSARLAHAFTTTLHLGDGVQQAPTTSARNNKCTDVGMRSLRGLGGGGGGRQG
eukprot:scaffold9756_cov69-Attheya_sp.AAC.2